MQHQHLAMLESNLFQGFVKGVGVFFRKCRFRRFLRVIELSLLGLFPGNVAADSIHCDSMSNGVQPRSQRARFFQTTNATKGSNPHVLKNVEPAVQIADQTGGIVKQRPLHDGDKIFKSARFPGLATERDPLVSGSILTIHMRSLLMSKRKRLWFNLPGWIRFG